MIQYNAQIHFVVWCIVTFQNISKRTLTIEPWSSSWSPKTRCRYGACLRIPFWPDVAKYVMGFRLLTNLRLCYNVCRIESWFAIVSKFSTAVIQIWPIRNYSTPQCQDLTITWKHREQMRDAFSKQQRHRACWNNSPLVVATVKFYLIKIQQGILNFQLTSWFWNLENSSIAMTAYGVDGHLSLEFVCHCFLV